MAALRRTDAGLHVVETGLGEIPQQSEGALADLGHLILEEEMS